MVADAVSNAAPFLTELGAEVDDRIPDLSEAGHVFKVQRAYDFLSMWGDIVRAEEARAGGSRIKEAVVWNTQLGVQLSVEDLVSLDSARNKLWASTQEYFSVYDVLVLPTAQILPFDADLEYPQTVNDKAVESYLDWLGSLTLISATGCPAISVPGGFSESGLPIGIQIVAAPGRDVDLLRVAHAFESVTSYAKKRPAI